MLRPAAESRSQIRGRAAVRRPLPAPQIPSPPPPPPQQIPPEPPPPPSIRRRRRRLHHRRKPPPPSSPTAALPLPTLCGGFAFIRTSVPIAGARRMSVKRAARPRGRRARCRASAGAQHRQRGWDSTYRRRWGGGCSSRMRWCGGRSSRPAAGPGASAINRSVSICISFGPLYPTQVCSAMHRLPTRSPNPAQC